MSATRLEYEKEPCRRCGGSGTYSRCQRWGTTCFECGTKPGVPGSGLALTKEAAKSREMLHAFLVERFSVPARDVQPGMQIKTADTDPYRTVVDAKDRPDLTWSSRAGDVTEYGHFVSIQTRGLAIQVDSEGSVRRRPSPEEFKEIVVPFALTLPGVCIGERP